MNLSYAYISINILTLALIVLTFIATINRWEKRGGKELGLLIVFMFIGSACVFIESLSTSFESKLLWRNISQIGLFLLPASSYNFIMAYTDENNMFLKRMRLVNFLFAVICVMLIFTNNFHHIMRISVELSDSTAGMVIKVNQTLIGKVCVALNTLMNLVAMIKLWIFMRTTSKNTRSQVRMVLIGFLIPIIYTYTKSSILNSIGIEIPTPLSFLIGILFVLYGMYRYDFMSISPIARDWVIDEINVGMVFSNTNGEIVDTNRYVEDTFKNGIQELKLIIEKNEAWNEAILSNQDMEFDLTYESHDTKIFHIKVHKLKKSNKSLGTVSLINDITKEKSLQMQLIERAEKDSMTQILNRKAFEEKVNDKLNNKMGEEEKCALLIIDIDYFKQINDRFGHHVGDKVIKDIVNIISNCSREEDLIGRLGGDEFTMFISKVTVEDVKKIVDRIQTSIGSFVFRAKDTEFKVTISIGASIQNKANYSFTELYREADKALYVAKEKGRNRVSYFSRLSVS